MNARLLVLLAALSSSAGAQTATSAAAPIAPVDTPAAKVAEPEVRLTVIEDRGTRIEELRVRGQLTRVSVRPAGGAGRGYEFLPERDFRDDAEGRSGSSAAVGKRVWRVLAF